MPRHFRTGGSRLYSSVAFGGSRSDGRTGISCGHAVLVSVLAVGMPLRRRLSDLLPGRTVHRVLWSAALDCHEVAWAALSSIVPRGLCL